MPWAQLTISSWPSTLKHPGISWRTYAHLLPGRSQCPPGWKPHGTNNFWAGCQFTLTESHTVTRSVMTHNECIMAGSAISRSHIILFNVIGWMFLLDMGNEPWMSHGWVHYHFKHQNLVTHTRIFHVQRCFVGFELKIGSDTVQHSSPGFCSWVAHEKTCRGSPRSISRSPK